MTTAGALEDVFAEERPRLVGLAYRITGSRLDAEDLVQEAWLRAQRVDWATVDRPAAWLTTVVSRLALDELRSARHRRETYVGPWLPEPVRTDDAPGDLPERREPPPQPDRRDQRDQQDPADAVELAESLTLGFLRLLEALDPVERVVFLLADVFDTPFGEIAAVVDRSPAACRQVASRARRRVREGRHRHDPPAAADQVVRSLLTAVAAGDVDRVIALMADDVELLSDGGGLVLAARRPVVGPRKVARFLVNLAKRYTGWTYEVATINDEPGVIVSRGGRLEFAMAIHIREGQAHALHAIRNPDKLTALAITTPLR
jgi:RNA polymerase sigma-70 factor (ECF subfamily)